MQGTRETYRKTGDEAVLDQLDEIDGQGLY